MKNILIITVALFLSSNLFGQAKDKIYRIEGHNYSTNYSYDVNLLVLNGDNNSYELINQEYLSKRLKRKNVIFRFIRRKGTYVVKGDTLYLKEKQSGKENMFYFLSKKKLVKLIEGKEKSKYIWRKVDN